MGVCSFANIDCTSKPGAGGFARLTPGVLQWIRSVKVRQTTHVLFQNLITSKINSWQHHKISEKDQVIKRMDEEITSLKRNTSYQFAHINQQLKLAKEEINFLKKENIYLKEANQKIMKEQQDDTFTKKTHENWEVCLRVENPTMYKT